MEDEHTPYSMEAEQSLLGALMYDNTSFYGIKDTLRPAHFYTPTHVDIYRSLYELLSAGKFVDAIVLKNRFSQEESLSDIGGVEYLALLLDSAPVGAAVPEYAKIIIDHSKRREVMSICGSALLSAKEDMETPASTTLDKCLDGLVSIQRQGTGQGKFATTQDAVEALLNPERPAMIDTGFQALDRIGRLPRGGLTLLGGRASMGKSALMIELAFNAARRGLRVDLFSMEMSKQQIAARAISSAIYSRTGTFLPYRDIHEGCYPEDMRAEVIKTSRALPNINFDDTSRLTVSDIKARCADRTGDMDLIFIDYLNIMSLVDCTEADRHDQKLGLVASKLRDFAKSTNAAVVLLCQLNRGAVNRDNNVPMLHDLRDSGELEQHADTVLFVHREHYYKSRALLAREASGETVSKAEWGEVNSASDFFDVIVAKQRMGEVNTALLKANIELNYIGDRN